MLRHAPFAAVLAGCLAVPGLTAAEDDAYCTEQWPRSDVMREYCLQTQRHAGHRLEDFAAATGPGTPDARRLAACTDRWARDLEMRWRCLDGPTQLAQTLN